MSNTANIDSVQSFWDAHPLFAGEIDEPIGTEQWFLACDKIKTYDVFAGDITDWTSATLNATNVLDVGCGPGYWNRLLQDHDIDYHGIDLSSQSVQLAKASQDLFDIPGKICVGNAESLAFSNESFDCVISEGVIHHTPNTQKCIDEIYRVLRKGGRACVSVYYKNVILRHPALFSASLKLMRLFGISLKGRGRSGMCYSENPADFVRMYDGKANPIGKAYTKRELQNMFQAFRKVSFKFYYIPSRIIPVQIPLRMQRIMAAMFGLMILVKADK